MQKSYLSSRQITLVAWGLMAVCGLGTLVSAQDQIILGDLELQSGSPQLFFTDTDVPYFWEIFADSTFFDIFDDSIGTNPFRISAGAPDYSLYIGADGRIGFGTDVPDVNSGLDTRASGLINGMLMKRTDAGPHYLRIEDVTGSVFRCGVQGNGDTQFGALTPGKGLALVAGGTGKLSINASGQLSFGSTPPIITTHALVHTSGARLTAAGVWTNASSRSFKQDIEPITSAEARDTVRALQPVGYRYKNELDERYVGFIAEDVPELVATRDRKALAPMDIVGVLTKVVQDQDRELAEERRRNDKLERLVDSLMQRVTDLEQRGDGAAPAK